MYRRIDNSYMTSAFFIYLDTEEDLNKYPALSQKTLRILAHEYIHFLQDITTVYGLMNIIHFVDEIKASTKTIITRGNKIFARPICYDSFDFVSTNRDGISLYRGDTNISGSLKAITGYSIHPNRIIKNYEHASEIVLDYVTSDAQKASLSLGGYCVCESMAACLEEFLYGDTCDLSNFPYKIVQILSRNLYDKFPDDKRCIIALCDVALNSYHPAKQLHDILSKMKQCNYQPNDFNDVYSFCNGLYYKEDGKDYNYIDLYKKLSQTALEQLTDYFPSIEEADLKQWCTNLMEIGRKLFDNQWLKRLLYKEAGQASVAFESLRDDIGLPIVSNTNNQFIISNKLGVLNNKASIIRAIFDIFCVLREPNATNCTMKELCGKSPINIVDSRCDKAPWLRADDSLLCPFGQLWYKWGLKGYAPEIQ
jgi:hypothetical protein